MTLLVPLTIPQRTKNPAGCIIICAVYENLPRPSGPHGQPEEINETIDYYRRYFLKYEKMFEIKT